MDDGSPINLTSSNVTLSMRDYATGTLKVTASPVVIISAVAGTVRYDWTVGDASLGAGYYYGRFDILYADGRQLSVPNSSWFTLLISDIV